MGDLNVTNKTNKQTNQTKPNKQYVLMVGLLVIVFGENNLLECENGGSKTLDNKLIG